MGYIKGRPLGGWFKVTFWGVALGRSWLWSPLCGSEDRASEGEGTPSPWAGGAPRAGGCFDNSVFLREVMLGKIGVPWLPTTAWAGFLSVRGRSLSGWGQDAGRRKEQGGRGGWPYPAVVSLVSL